METKAIDSTFHEVKALRWILHHKWHPIYGKYNSTNDICMCLGIDKPYEHILIFLTLLLPHTAWYVPAEICAMYWCKFCPGHRILYIEWWLHPHINSLRNLFAWLNDPIRMDSIVFNIQHMLLHSCPTYFILGQWAKLFCQVITELSILCTRIGTQNKCQKYGMHCLATQVLSLLDGDSSLPPFCIIHIKMWRWSRRYGFTARNFRLFVPAESILIPSGSLYTK